MYENEVLLLRKAVREMMAEATETAEKIAGLEQALTEAHKHIEGLENYIRRRDEFIRTQKTISGKRHRMACSVSRDKKR
jgi:peptidoglycan hydrolase CwlO-like protein